MCRLEPRFQLGFLRLHRFAGQCPYQQSMWAQPHLLQLARPLLRQQHLPRHPPQFVRLPRLHARPQLGLRLRRLLLLAQLGRQQQPELQRPLVQRLVQQLRLRRQQRPGLQRLLLRLARQRPLRRRRLALQQPVELQQSRQLQLRLLRRLGPLRRLQFQQRLLQWAGPQPQTGLLLPDRAPRPDHHRHVKSSSDLDQRQRCRQARRMEKQSVPPRSRSFQLFGQNHLRAKQAPDTWSVMSWISKVYTFYSSRYYGRRSGSVTA